jgi:hypothetical protein
MMVLTGAPCRNARSERGKFHPRGGFILPLTLWTIAIVGLVAAVINVWVAKAVANSQALAQRTQLELSQSNLRNELVYTLGRRASSYRGVEIGPRTGIEVNDFNSILSGPVDSGRYLKLDGYPYTAESDPNTVITIQDGAGLLNLNIATPANIRRTLAVFNIPDPQINRLIDTLLDYIDEDDLNRLAGAEKTQYMRLNLPAPSNALLLSPLEAQRVLGWDKLDELWRTDMDAPFLTTCQSPAFNLNTAPIPVLIANIRGMTRDKAEQTVGKRAARPFRNVREFAAASDLLIADEPFFYTFVPGSCVIVDMIDKISGQHVRFSLTLEPTSQTRPWRVDYATRIPSQYRAALDRLDPEAVFPTPESLDLSSGPDDRPPKPQ